MKQSVLVTGASGFVGSKVFERLRVAETNQCDGLKVTGIGRRELRQDGYRSLDLTRELPPIDSACRAIVHAAARASPWGSRREFARQNIDVTRRLIKACENSGCPKFVFISSPSIYYRPGHQFDISEQTPRAERAINHYAWSKQQAEILVQAYRGPSVILRPRAIYGPGDTVLFPRILKAAAAGKLPLIGEPDRRVVCDLLFIDNLVDVIVKSVTDDRIEGEFNLSDNDPVEIETTLLHIFRQLEIPAPTRRVPVRRAMLAAGAIEAVYRTLMPFREPPITRYGIHVFAYSKTFDVSKMLETFGPPAINAGEGIQRFIDWVRSEQPYRD